MGKRFNIHNANISRFRTIIQLFSFIFLVWGSYSLIYIGSRIPVFACPYNDGSPGSCFLISLQHLLHAEWKELLSWSGIALLTTFLTFIFLLIILNKAWCGFICPFGTLQDWLTKLRSYLGIRFTRLNQREFKRLSIIKYLFLAFLIVTPLLIDNSFFGAPKVNKDMGAPFCQICPARCVMPTFTGDTSQFAFDYTSKTKMVMSSIGIFFTALFLVGSFIKKRFFCLICPLSSLQYFFSRIGLLTLRKDGTKCTKCGNCSRVCDIGIKAIEEDIIHKNAITSNCMMCFKCVEACPENNALKVSFIRIPIFRSTPEGFFKRYPAGTICKKSDENEKKS